MAALSHRVATIERQTRHYVAGVREAIQGRSRRLNDLLRDRTTAGNPYRVDVLLIGAGPHNAVAAVNLRNANPDIRLLTVEAGDRMGTFDAVRGFHVNTREKPLESGNTFPGAPIQPRDLNARGEVFVSATNFGDITALAHHYARSDVAFGNRAVKITERPAGPEGEGWKGRYRVEMANGNVVFTDRIVVGTGLGEPVMKVNDAASQRIIDREAERNRDGIWDPEYRPLIQTVDDFLRLQDMDVTAGRDPMSRYGTGVVAVIGGGDGGNIAVEGVLGLTGTLNPTGREPRNRVLWIGQKATNAGELKAGMSDLKWERYGQIGTGYDKGLIDAASGRLVAIREVREGERTRFELTYQQFDEAGKPIAGTSRTALADHVVFATGYRNRVLSLLEGLKGDGKGEVEVKPYTADTSDFTTNPRLGGENNVAGRVQVDGKDHDIYVVGNAAKVNPRETRFDPTEANWRDAVGGFLDILLQRTAAFARDLGNRTAKEWKPRELREGSRPDTRFEAPVSLPHAGAPFYVGLTGTALQLKVEAGRFLNRFRFPVNRPVRIEILKGAGGNVSVRVTGLDEASARELIRALESTPQGQAVLGFIRDYHAQGGKDLVLGLRGRQDGSIRSEQLELDLKGPVSESSPE